MNSSPAFCVRHSAFRPFGRPTGRLFQGYRAGCTAACFTNGQELLVFARFLRFANHVNVQCSLLDQLLFVTISGHGRLQTSTLTTLFQPFPPPPSLLLQSSPARRLAGLFPPPKVRQTYFRFCNADTGSKSSCGRGCRRRRRGRYIDVNKSVISVP